MANKKDYAIGVFDSGLGGLTVVKELIKNLPHENIVYFGDTARVPYGTKSRESIIQFSKENVKLLLRHKVKMVVVACNSSSSHAINILKKGFNLPIIGVIRPGVKKAVNVTKNKKIGVIATQATIHSQSYRKQLKKHNSSIRVVPQACPLFVPLVEEGWVDRKVTINIAQEYLKKIKNSKADVVILGCTHYPLLKSTIRKVMGPKVALIDSAKEVALEVKSVLEKEGLMSTRFKKGRYQFLVSDEPQHFKTLAQRFLGGSISNVTRSSP